LVPAYVGSVTDVAFLLAPGANGGAEHPTLLAIEAAVAPAVVARVALPSRKAVERVVAEAAELAARAGVAPEDVVLGGRSYGGRMCSMAVAAGLPARGLVLISYPLHPPGRPDQVRTGHFPDIGVPCLFVSGKGDAFARPDELAVAVAAIPAPTETVWLDGGGHGLRGRDPEVVALVSRWVSGLRG